MSSDGAAPAPARVRQAVPGDFAAALALLQAAALPTVGVPRSLGHFLVAEEAGRLVGVVGLEVYPKGALLRSAAIHHGVRGTGVGTALVRAALEHARASGVAEVYLLTTTAEGWFPRFGFERTSRAEASDAIGTSAEFLEACPASAVVMRLAVRPV